MLQHNNIRYDINSCPSKDFPRQKLFGAVWRILYFLFIYLIDIFWPFFNF